MKFDFGSYVNIVWHALPGFGSDEGGVGDIEGGGAGDVVVALDRFGKPYGSAFMPRLGHHLAFHTQSVPEHVGIENGSVFAVVSRII